MKNAFLYFLLLLSFHSFAQIKGTVTDEKGNPLPFINVFEENTYNGTTTNELGKYQLHLKSTGRNKIVFQYLGFKTQKIAVSAEKLNLPLDVKMIEENFTLNEVIISTKDNPANAIIKKAIASKKENTRKTSRFKADFYSRGIFKLKNAPKKIFGQKIGDMNGALDSTGTGIISLSETFSKIIYEKPNNLKEVVTASKVSGDNKGYAYNTARSSFYDFYDNTIRFGINMISPIADNAFNYYKYKLESTFVDENNQTINKIKVIAKRDKEPVFEGYIYILENSWAIYGIDLDIKGYRMKEDVIDVMTLKQNFSYNETSKIWAKKTQSLDFSAGLFGIKFSGKYTYVYNNYEFVDSFDKKTFTSEITTVDINSNKKDTVFWNANRPIPLTTEEITDYIRKDSIHKVRNSPKYLDSIDKKGNKFKFLDPITGYTYKSSFKKFSLGYKGLLDFSSLSFNTVQGWNFDTGFSYSNWKNEEKGRQTNIDLKINYGFSDDRVRINGKYWHQFNNQNYANIQVSGGTSVAQFNRNEPISPFINSISTLFFKDNYMKLYNLEFAKIEYGQDIANGINLKGKIEYEQRKPLFNTTDYTFINKDKLYSSNNPLNPDDYINSGFEKHSLAKLNLTAKINFGNKYASRPDGKYNIRNSNYPTLYLGLEKGFAGTEKKYEFTNINTQIKYSHTFGNKGDFGLSLKAGKFFDAENIAFMDYQHFNGNQTYVGLSGNYLNVFNLMPYYTNSTNDSYFEFHTEHNDRGFIMNKIPLLNLLKSNLVVGYHLLAEPNINPYSEYSVGLDNLGFGKLKMFRIDYLRSYQNGFQNEGVIVGIKFMN
ncbi:DUF5686 and carboxypeptidase regulatory-like domain-containing protein [Flavobacterium sp. HJJ]|uniref:DUF5686 and carboxypeptidase regulatory-like domain-containing protein n=1 Tax=Flavobacterium sp. HJJ TaxID=2783792 RepID=UPI00188D4949|nr:DUF5686 and carboxypeptidase regulatory-like domain-containing protein [Flavobacterium sp. HJJ]MBF4470450.1 carboxypeptidase-like regulatory domain-containing protein [Flavobacterium sp. HJJ]